MVRDFYFFCQNAGFRLFDSLPYGWINLGAYAKKRLGHKEGVNNEELY